MPIINFTNQRSSSFYHAIYLMKNLAFMQFSDKWTLQYASPNLVKFQYNLLNLEIRYLYVKTNFIKPFHLIDRGKISNGFIKAKKTSQLYTRPSSFLPSLKNLLLVFVKQPTSI